jgi:uncharacterized protein (DUF2252 family)
MGESFADRRARGRALRELVPRGSHEAWEPDGASRDPVATVRVAADGRLPELVPIRHERMAASPFAFLRGTADVMALDLATTPTTGLHVQACGDAHILNFGEFATPERNVIFDVNDFDETHPAPFEWDLKRLAASLEVAMRGNGDPPRRRERAVTAAVGVYRDAMARYATLGALDLWYARINVDDIVSYFPRRFRGLVRRDLARARRKTHARAYGKLTEVVDGRSRFVDDPPIIVRLEDTEHTLSEVYGVIESYRESLSDRHRALFDRFRFVDVARKAVGLGSIGTRCWVALFEGPDRPGGDPLVLQVKQASPSVLEAVTERSDVDEHHGLRVVAGQRLTQAASDMFLGWATAPVSDNRYYVRQLWDVKGSGDPTVMEHDNLARYGSLCAWALARAHARTGDPAVIASYLGKGTSFDRAVAAFARRYADQVELDHAALVAVLIDGQLVGPA